MGYNLFLDDEREPYLDPININKLGIEIFNFVSAYYYTKYKPFKDENWIIVRNYKEFIKIIKRLGIPDKVSFDHDLSDEHYPNYDKNSKNLNTIKYDNYTEKTGYDCAKWLCEYCKENNKKFPEYFIHSWNKIGAINIKTYIENCKKHYL